MKKFTLILLLFFFSVTLFSQTATPPAAGDGTIGNPYQIATLDNLYWITQSDTAWDKSYIQTANIDATTTNTWDAGVGYLPIGNATTKFTGSYNGQGHIIDKLFTDRTLSTPNGYIGFIGYADGASIDSLGLTNMNIAGSEYIGFIGRDDNSTINACYSTGIVSGSTRAGGLLGVSVSSVITNCYSSAAINTSANIAGGFIGACDNSVIDNCYSTGEVICPGVNVGGLIGSYANMAISNSFWDTETSGQTTSVGGTGKTTAEMQDITTFTAIATTGLDVAWDFIGTENDDAATGDYWKMNSCLNAYPVLSWQKLSAPTLGDGTTANPYQIATICDLRWLSETDTVWDKNFIQTADIDALETNTWNSGEGFSPIGNSTLPFIGFYNGKGHTIDALFMNRSTHYNGLFGCIHNGATLDSLGITNCDITGNNTIKTGAIAGEVFLNVEIRSCFATGTITGSSYVGGMSGSIQAANITNCYSNVEVIASGNYVGGITGYSNNGDITNCYSTGVINGNTDVGGLVGAIVNTPTITNSFWDIETSGQTSSAGGTGKTTAEMQDITTFTAIATTGLDIAWDFIGTENDDAATDDYWMMNSCLNAYPVLSWQKLSAPTLGDGTTANPYQIATLCDLRWLSETDTVWDKNFIQTADIDALETNTWNSGAGFSPIGNVATKFTGAYNGQDYTLDGLFINIPATTGMTGLFGYINLSSVRNLNLTNIDITGKDQTGGLAGYAGTSTVDNISCSGTLNGASYVGGVVGLSYQSIVDSCVNTTAINGSNNMGGVVGYNNISCVISNSYNLGDVTGTAHNVGGLVGLNHSSSSVTNSYSAGNVIGTNNIGGLVGYNSGSSVINSYSTGIVSGTGNIGGLVGSEINSPTVSNSFWDTETSTQATSAGGTGKTTVEMQTLCMYIDGTEASWDFMDETTNGSNDYWGLNGAENGGYPFLSWQGFQNTEKDSELPVLTVQDLTLQLDESGNATITAFDLVTSASDNCAVADTTLSLSVFDCANVGTPVNVDVTLSDISGNEVTQTSVITVEDNILPSLTVQNFTAQLDENGNAFISASDVVTSASDNCATADTTLNQTNFDCTNIGIPTDIDVILTDTQGNLYTQTTSIIVNDNTIPTITCVGNQEVTADAGNTYTVSATEFDPTATADNCGIASVINDFNGTSTLAASELPEGLTTIIWTITDYASNQATCTFDVQVNEFVGIDELSNSEISIYPNPTSGIVTVNLQTSVRPCSVSITDIAGKTVKQLSINSNKLTADLSNQSAGIYFIKIQTETGIFYEKIIKK